MNQNIIEFRDVSIFWDEHPVVQDFSLELPAGGSGAGSGRITALLGPGRSGKSSILAAVNRLIDEIPGSSVEGSISVLGADVRGGWDVNELRRRVGTIFPVPNPFPVSIYENIAWAARLHGHSEDLDALVQESLERTQLWFEIKDKLRQPAMRLSAGQIQRLCLSRALAVGPDLLLLDDATAALDPISTQKFEECLDGLGIPILFATQNAQQAARVSHQTAVLLPDPGAGRAQVSRLVEFGPTRALFANPQHRLTEDFLAGKFFR